MATTPTTVKVRDIPKRWTPSLIDGGWTPVSNKFLLGYHRLRPKISHAEVLLVIHLMLHKWDGQAPYPSLVTIAARMGISDTAVRNYVRSLKSKRYLRCDRSDIGTNRFHLEGLFAALEQLDIETLKERAANRKSDTAQVPEGASRHAGKDEGEALPF